MKNNRLFIFGGIKVVSCEANPLLEGFSAPDTHFPRRQKTGRAGKGKLGVSKSLLSALIR